MKHTSIRIPDGLYRRAIAMQKERGIETFAGVVAEALRYWLQNESELRSFEKRIVAAVDRLAGRIDRSGDAGRAAFALNMAVAEALVGPRLPGVLRNAQSEYAGLASKFMDGASMQDEQARHQTQPDAEDIPFGE